MDQKEIDRIYKLIKSGVLIEDLAKKLGITYEEVFGIIELCKAYGKKIDIVEDSEKKFVIIKNPVKKIIRNIKSEMDDLVYTQICVISDTHLGNIHQQLHLINEVYSEAYQRGVNLVLHVGDLVDGDYLSIRKEQGRQMFLNGFDQQCGYVCDMYPRVSNITTKFILGSHDETHYKNGGATLGEWIPRTREDMEYLGQDVATIDVNGVKIMLDHPGGGCAASLSYKVQKRIEELESGFKPKILLIGHYHKSYYCTYRNVRGILVPCLCDKTQFQQKQGLSNVMGAYFLHIYSNRRGDIQYFEPEGILFDQSSVWDEAGKDKSKVKQLVIK